MLRSPSLSSSKPPSSIAVFSSLVPALIVCFAPGIYDGFFIFLVWTSALNSALAGTLFIVYAALTGLTVDSRAVKPGFLFAALAGVAVHGAEFIGPALRMGAGAILTDASFHRANLRGAILDDVSAIGANFNLVDATKTSFKGADLSRAMMYGAQLSGADFSNADMTEQQREALEAKLEAKAAAGQANLKLTLVNNRAFTYFGVYVADQLSRIGVTVDHQALDTPQVAARRISGDYDLIFDSPAEYSDDPSIQLAYFEPFSTNRANLARFGDPKVVALYQAQLQDFNPQSRKQRVRDLESYLMEQSFVMPLFWQSRKRVMAAVVSASRLASSPKWSCRLAIWDLSCPKADSLAW